MSQGNDSLKFYVLILVILLILAFVTQNWILWILFILAILFGAFKILHFNKSLSESNGLKSSKTKIIKIPDEEKVKIIPKNKINKSNLSKEDKIYTVVLEVYNKIINNPQIEYKKDAYEELYNIIGSSKRTNYFNSLLSKNYLEYSEGEHIITILKNKIESGNFKGKNNENIQSKDEELDSNDENKKPKITKKDRESNVYDEIYGKIINNPLIKNKREANNELYQIIGASTWNDYFKNLLLDNDLNDFDGQHIINSLIKSIDSQDFSKKNKKQ